MTEEELFYKLFPDYAVNGKPLSPYFDLFESGYEQAEKRIEELEKENAELKDDNKVMADNYSKMEQKFYDNLAKAKEIIKKYYKYSPGCEYFYEDIDKEAEQFLNEVEK